jgi:septal ring factor EnvC (AmiA/AmiB activator)
VDEVHTEQERWLKFFVEGEGLDEARLPDWMKTEEMRQAMSTLQGFSDKERAYHRYQARQDYLRQQQSIENRMRALLAEAEQARAEKEAARAEKEAARAAEERERAEKEVALAAEERERAEKEAALAEIERLKALLQSQHVGNDANPRP